MGLTIFKMGGKKNRDDRATNLVSIRISLA
jgi:hypothetical protein